MPKFPDPGAPPVPPASAGKPGSDLPSAVSYFFALAAISGGGLSLAAAVGLMRREAKRYFADPGDAANTATDGDFDGNTGYFAVRPATVITRLRWDAVVAACQS